VTKPARLFQQNPPAPVSAPAGPADFEMQAVQIQVRDHGDARRPRPPLHVNRTGRSVTVSEAIASLSSLEEGEPGTGASADEAGSQRLAVNNAGRGEPHFQAMKNARRPPRRWREAEHIHGFRHHAQPPEAQRQIVLLW